MSFHVGQLVVCVDDGEHPEWRRVGQMFIGDLDGLTRGTVYTVRDVLVDDHDSPTGVGVRVFEIRRPMLSWETEETPYASSRFRPVDETRIEIFKRIAASPKERIRVGEDA